MSAHRRSRSGPLLIGPSELHDQGVTLGGCPEPASLQALLDRFVDEYNRRRPHRSLAGRTPAAAYQARPKAAPAGTHQAHYRVRHDKVNQGNVSLRVAGVLHHIGLGRTLDGTPVIMLINDLDVRVIHATTGEIIRTLTIDPDRRYHGTGAPTGGPRRPDGTQNHERPNPKCRFGRPGCLATSHVWSWGESNPRPSAGGRTRYDHSRHRS